MMGEDNDERIESKYEIIGKSNRVLEDQFSKILFWLHFADVYELDELYI